MKPVCQIIIAMVLVLTSSALLAAGPTTGPSESSEPGPRLTDLIQCHEALAERSDGTSQKMDLKDPTPFVLSKGGRLYFVTDSTISVVNLQNPPQGKGRYVVTLLEHGKEVSREIELRDDNALGSVCCGNGKGLGLKELTPTAELTLETRSLIKAELQARFETVKDEYQNSYWQMKSAKAVKVCNKLNLIPAPPKEKSKKPKPAGAAKPGNKPAPTGATR